MESHSSAEIFQAWSEETAAASVLHVAGDVDLLSAPSLREHLMRLIIEGQGHPIIVDCSALQYLDMQGVRVLEDCHRRAEREGLRFVLVGSSPLVHRLLTIVQLDQRIPVVDTVVDALQTLGKDP